MAETDGIEEAAEQLLRTATITAAQIVEQLALARKQRLRDDASSARDKARADAQVGRDRDQANRSMAKAEEAATESSSRARSTAASGVNRVLAADTAERIVEHAASGSAWDNADRHAAFGTELAGIADREAVAARLLLDRARAHPASSASEPQSTAPALPLFARGAVVDPGLDSGR